MELLDWYEDSDRIVLVLERPIPCMDLGEFCWQNKAVLSEEQVRDIMRQVLQAVCHCHDRGVFHSDIKPTNILINTDTLKVKLIDFGCGDWLQRDPYTHYSGNCTMHM